MRGRHKVSGATKVMFLILRSCALGRSWPSGGHSLSLSLIVNPPALTLNAK